MGTDGRWILMLFRDGRIKYATSPGGDFQSPPAEPYRFCTKQAAIAAYNKWAVNHPEEHRRWKIRFLEE